MGTNEYKVLTYFDTQWFEYTETIADEKVGVIFTDLAAALQTAKNWSNNHSGSFACVIDRHNLPSKEESSVWSGDEFEPLALFHYGQLFVSRDTYEPNPVKVDKDTFTDEQVKLLKNLLSGSWLVIDENNKGLKKLIKDGLVDYSNTERWGSHSLFVLTAKGRKIAESL